MAASISLKDRSIYEQLCKDYLNLKTIASGICDRDSLIGKLKDDLKPEVGSVRRISKVGNAEDLWRLLEGRNLLSMIKFELFKRIGAILNDVDFDKFLEMYKLIHQTNRAMIRRFYLEDLRYRDRRSLLEREIEAVKLNENLPDQTKTNGVKLNEFIPSNRVLSKPAGVPSSTSSSSSSSKNSEKFCQAIHDLLVREIGRDWNTLGRHLGHSVASLYSIEERHPKDVKARILDIVIEAENEAGDWNHFIVQLLQALEDSRRKDLKRKIDKLLSL
ncbi:fas-associated death domain protein [Uranotaenia lowii]|uniref:fas-associated death domain protein n=1 Tax=Uranotaenia lowii TaxID=190385 RepID=UPI00247AB803|nr:fas-associated death domain protein [Uranotaenia lowii]